MVTVVTKGTAAHHSDALDVLEPFEKPSSEVKPLQLSCYKSESFSHYNLSLFTWLGVISV